MAQARLSKPSDVNPQNHAEISDRLRALIARISSERGFSRLRLRDWDLIRREGLLYCDIVLDKGHSWLQYDDFIGHPDRDDNLEVVDIDECVAVHKALLEDLETLAFFDDSVHFEIGSAGEEPPLRSRDDFEKAIGLMVRTEPWTKGPKEAKSKGRLLRVGGMSPDGTFRIEIEAPVAPGRSQENLTRAPLVLDSSSLRRAALLLFDPGNFAKPN